MISSLVWHQVCFSEGNYRRMPQIPPLHLGGILVFYLGTMETCLVSGQGFLNFSNSRKRKHHTVNKIDPQPASYPNISNMATRENSHLANYSTECWVNLREIGVCEVSVKQHDLETFPRRSCVLLVLERQTQWEENLGKPLQATAEGNSTVSICTGFFHSDVFHQPHSDWFHLRTLLAVLVDEAWWQNLWHFLILPRPSSSCVVSWRFGP